MGRHYMFMEERHCKDCSSLQIKLILIEIPVRIGFGHLINCF